MKFESLGLRGTKRKFRTSRVLNSRYLEKRDEMVSVADPRKTITDDMNFCLWQAGDKKFEFACDEKRVTMDKPTYWITGNMKEDKFYVQCKQKFVFGGNDEMVVKQIR